MMEIFHWNLSDVQDPDRMKAVSIILKKQALKSAIMVLHDVHKECLNALHVQFSDTRYKIIAGSPHVIKNRDTTSCHTMMLYPRDLYTLTDMATIHVGEHIAEVYVAPPKVVIPEPTLIKSLCNSVRCMVTGKTMHYRKDATRETYNNACRLNRRALICVFMLKGDPNNKVFKLCAYRFPASWKNTEILTLHTASICKIAKVFGVDHNQTNCKKLPIIMCFNGNFTPQMRQYQQVLDAGFQDAFATSAEKEGKHDDERYTCRVELPDGDIFEEVIDYIFVRGIKVESSMETIDGKYRHVDQSITCHHPSSKSISSTT